MLIALLLVLSAVKVNGESLDQDGLRRSRQLDLGLQDIRNGFEETPSTIQSVQKDEEVLPPVSSSLSPQVISTGSEKDDLSVNFGNVTELSESKVPTPSSDLVPPFNDLEQALAAIKPTAAVEEAQTTFEEEISFVTTTEKPTFKETSTQNSRIGKATGSGVELNNAEATNELRSYLPPQPEFSAAAQTNVAVVQPANQNDEHDHDHHHGHHHHGDDFDICADAFHSFLCAPLKARKRITGALPSNLKGQSSFVNYQKVLPNFDRETAPSNAFRNEYLPPRLPPTNLIQSSFRPSSTTRRPITTTVTTTTTTARPYSPPKILPEPSNPNDRFYLPPLTDNKIFNPAPSFQPVSTAKPTTTTFRTTRPPVTSIASNLLQNGPSAAPTIPKFNSFSSNENSLYLPPNPNPQPSGSFASTSLNIFPLTSTLQPSTFVPLPVVTSIEYLPPSSVFVSQSPEPQPTVPVFTTTARPLTSAATTFKPSLQFSPFASQPSNPDSSYLPPIPQFQASPTTTTTTFRPSTPKLVPQPANADRAYLPPDPRETAAAQVSSAAVAPPQVKNPFHHGRDLCTDPFHSFLCSSAKPRKRITGQLPSGFKPESSNQNESRLKPEPSSQDESKVLPEKPLEGASAQNVGYKYPKPVNPLPTPSNAVPSQAFPGYSYPKPDKIFPSSSQQDVKTAFPTTTKRPEPTFRASEAKAVGYQYPKPDKILPLPGNQGSIKVSTTTNPPTTGYSYPKPQKPFPLPTEQREVKVGGYQYPKPEQSLKLPEKKGYSYPKPEKRLELPTEARSKSLLPQTNSNLDALQNLGSADFIPVNKLEFKRSESSKLVAGLRRFGERMKKREREVQLAKGQSH